MWREPSDHHTDCYFCMVGSPKQRKGVNAPPIKYPDIPSCIAPVPHNTADLPVSQPPSKDQSCLAEASYEDFEKENASSLAVFMRRPRQLGNKKCPYYSNTEEINDLILEMALAKFPAKLLISRLKQ